jgi:hypothetical protein
MPLEGTPPVIPPATDNDCSQQNNIATKQTVVDGCSVLPKLQCHEVQMGQSARLLWNLKDQQGEPVNIAACLGGCEDDEVVFDAAGAPGCGVVLRMRELSGFDPEADRVHTVSASVIDSGQGLVRSSELPEDIVRYPGVYLEEWGLFSTSGSLIFSNTCYTFVRRGLFGISDDIHRRNDGPPTLEEIRLSLRDNSHADNMLLDDVEFDAAEMALSVLRPVQYWNETPPPLNPLLTTKTFPFREMWLMGIQAYLYDIAASHYRRNKLAYNAGGVAVDDKNKEQEYMAVSAQLMNSFRQMVQAKKVEINISMFSGAYSSPYSGRFY